MTVGEQEGALHRGDDGGDIEPEGWRVKMEEHQQPVSDADDHAEPAEGTGAGVAPEQAEIFDRTGDAEESDERGDDPVIPPDERGGHDAPEDQRAGEPSREHLAFAGGGGGGRRGWWVHAGAAI